MRLQTKPNPEATSWPSAHRQTLSNGAQLTIIPLPHLHTATVSAFIKLGSRDETSANNGISHFLEHMLFRGNHHYPSPYALHFAVENIGGDLYAATHADFTMYQMRLPPENLQVGMEILARFLTAPKLQDIDLERKIIREEILESLDDEGANVDTDDVARALVFANHPLAFPIAGNLQTLSAISTRDLRTHHATHYTGSNATICIAGAVEPIATAEHAAELFEKLPAGSQNNRVAFDDEQCGNKWRYVSYDDTQSDLRLSFRCGGEKSQSVASLLLLARVLDDGMSTRLHRVICDEKALAYDVFSALELYEECGVLEIGVTVAHAKVPQLAEELLELVAVLRQQLPANEEFDKARRRLLWDLHASIDDAAEIAYFYGVQSLLGSGKAISDLIAEVNGVTLAEVQQQALEVFSGARLHAACVGRLSEQSADATEKLITSFS